MQNIKQQLINDIASVDLKREKTSKISPYKDQLLILSQYLSYRELTEWLYRDKGVSISPPAIHYMIKKWKKTNMKTLAQITDFLLPSSPDSNPLKAKRRYTSKLDPYKTEIMILSVELNQSPASIRRWLNQKKISMSLEIQSISE